MGSQSLPGAIFQLLGLFLALGFVIFLAWLASRLIATRFAGGGRSRNLRVLDQVAIGRERQILLVEVAGKVLLLGSTATNVNLLTTIDDPAVAAELTGQQAAARSGLEPFGALLDRLLKKETATGAEQAAAAQEPSQGLLSAQIRRLKDVAKR